MCVKVCCNLIKGLSMELLIFLFGDNMQRFLMWIIFLKHVYSMFPQLRGYNEQWIVFNCCTMIVRHGITLNGLLSFKKVPEGISNVFKINSQSNGDETQC